MFTEGAEDAITGEIVTRLTKNVVKNSNLEIKFSDTFKNGAIGGMCFIEPYVDYSFDMINGDMKFKKISPLDIYLDPHFKEYDLSDSKFLIKVTADLSKDDLLALFPSEKKKIDGIGNGKIQIDNTTTGIMHFQGRDYPDLGSGKEIDRKNADGLPTYDLIDYFYKEMDKRYFCVISEKGIIEEFDKESLATEFNQKFGGIIIERNVPVIKHAQVCGDVELYNGVAWSYPRYRSYPIIPFFAELTTEDLNDLSLTIQGVEIGRASCRERV